MAEDEEPSLKEFINLPIVSWYEVGLQLGLKQFQLKRIQSTHANQPDFHVRCRSDVFQLWLESHPNPTYTDIHTALINCREKEAAQHVSELCAKVNQIPSSNPQSHCGPVCCAMTSAAIVIVAVIVGIVASMQEKNLPSSVGNTVTHLSASVPMTPSMIMVPTESTVTISHNEKRSTKELAKLIMTPGATGPEVVEACISKMANSEILGLPDDNGLMRRIAYVMSRDGKNMKSDGGIWQVSEFGFKDTKEDSAHYRLPSKWARINQAFGIDWPAVKRRDLEKPFYSALAARLYLSNFSERIPLANKIADQAWYWKYFYMRGSSGANEQDFVNAVAELD